MYLTAMLEGILSTLSDGLLDGLGVPMTLHCGHYGNRGLGLRGLNSGLSNGGPNGLGQSGIHKALNGTKQRPQTAGHMGGIKGLPLAIRMTTTAVCLGGFGQGPRDKGL